ncbi:MAG: PorT family protein [Bacteroidales bacterium]|nr:PorT family protein [Bacteroidales bacterium]
MKMKNRALLLFLALLMPFAAHAQWRVGVTGGADYNLYSMDKQYMTDFRIDGMWGATAGISGQYDIADWLAVRADLNWTQKNYRKHRVVLSQIDYRYRNDYLQLPVMASFSAGGTRLRGFCNLGVYAGYWLAGRLGGSDFNNFGDYVMDINESIVFNPESDQRLDFGPVGGLGLEYRLGPHWAAQAELRCYYSTVSTSRQYMRVRDYRYNTTMAAQLGVFYIF